MRIYHLRWHGLDICFIFFRKYALAKGVFFSTLPVSLVVTQTHACKALSTPYHGRRMSKSDKTKLLCLSAGILALRVATFASILSGLMFRVH